MKKITLFAICICFFLKAFNQNSTYYQATVYFTSGVTRTVTSSDTSATVSASDINAILTKYSLNGSDVYPAFPEFNEADTLLLPNLKIGRTDTIKQMDRANIFTITVPDTTTRNNLIQDLVSLSEVLFVEANGTDSFSTDPTDPDYHNQWYLNNLLNPSHDIHASGAWNIYKGNSNSIIGIIDDGVDITEPDVSPKIAGGDNNFYIETEANGLRLSHGTAVAGVAAASTNNGISMAGVDWQAHVLPENTHDYNLCFCWGFITKPHGWNLIAKKILSAVNFSSNVWTLNHSYELKGGLFGNNYSVVVAEAFAYAAKNNRVSCASSGNDQSNSTRIFPANYSSELIDVGGTDQNDVQYFKSNGGPNLDVVAPAVGIVTLNNTQFGSDVSLDGTSLASPMVAGIASLLKGYNPGLYNDDIEQIIKLSADHLGAVGRNDLYGYGRVNAATALSYLNSPYQLQHLTATGGTAYSTTSYALKILGGLHVSDFSYSGQKIEVRTTISLPTNYCSITGVWGTGLKTTGWHDDNGTCYGDGFCEVVPGSQTPTQVTLRTYVYHLYNLFGISIGYYPRSPQNVVFAYSILGIPQTVAISGPSTFCTSGSYTAMNVPVGSSILWSLSPASGIASLSSPPSTNPITVTNAGNGAVTLNATVNTCVASLPIIIGTPKISINYSMNGGCNGTFQTWSLAASAPGTVSSWLWTVDNPNSGNWYIYHPTFASTFVDVSGGGGISVTATNACGSSKQGVTIYSNCGHSNAIIASPNPTSSDLTVSLTQPLSTSTASTNSKTQTPKMIYQVLVADQAGNVRKQFNYSAGVNSTKINLTGLLSGTYTIVVFDGTDWNGVQVIKE